MGNVDLEAIDRTRGAIAGDEARARNPVDLGGTWDVTGAGPQFRGTIPFPQGEVEFACDFPPPLGGKGRAPNPLAYCLWGGIACYAMTFATEAASEGVEIRGLTARVTADVDVRRPLGISDAPPVEGLTWTLDVDSDAPPEEIERLRVLADAHCPGHYCITNPVPLETRVRAV